MAQAKKVLPTLAIIGVIGGIIYLATRAKAAPPPPPVYICPYCGAEFAIEEELLAHILAEHPEIPPEIPLELTIDVKPSDAGWFIKVPDKVSYDYRELVTITAYANEGYRFWYWADVTFWENGKIESYNPTIYVRMLEDIRLTAHFWPI